MISYFWGYSRALSSMVGFLFRLDDVLRFYDSVKYQIIKCLFMGYCGGRKYTPHLVNMRDGSFMALDSDP